MYGKTKKDRIRNEHIRETVGVTHIEDKLRENRLRWYGHVQRRGVDAPMQKSDNIVVSRDVRGGVDLDLLGNQ